MILKVPPSDLHKNANLAELRCNKKKNFLYRYSVYIEYFEVHLYLLNYALHACC